MPTSEVTVRRQTGIERKKQARAARKSARLRGSRRPKRLSARQKAAVRKRKGTGFYKKIAKLRSSMDLPATITGSISHRPEYIDAVLEAASQFDKDEKLDAREFARLFIEKDPAFSNTDTGMAAILFEAYIFEKAEEVVTQFLETQLEGPDTTFLAIFEGQIKDEALQKLATGVTDICTFETLVKAGDTNHEEGIVSDVTILECTPKRQKKSKAAAQEPEPTMRTEGLLPETTADYEAVIEEGGITDNAFMYLYPELWEAAQKGRHNGDILSARDNRGATWYCYEGVWLPDMGVLDEAKFKTAEEVRDHFFDKKRGYKVKIAGHTVEVVKASVAGNPPTVKWTGKNKGSGFVLDFLNIADPKEKKFPSKDESVDEAGGMKNYAKAYGVPPTKAGMKQALKQLQTDVKSGKKKGASVQTDLERLKHLAESVEEATLDQALKKAKVPPAKIKPLLKAWMKKKGLGDLTNIKNATVFVNGDKVQVNVEPFKGDRAQFNTRMRKFEESIEEGFDATFENSTRAVRFAREIRAHARMIQPHGLAVYYEAREADHTEENSHQEAIDELCKKHGGKKKRAKKPVKEEEGSHDLVAGPFLGDGEPRLIHNGKCEVLGFERPLQSGPLYLESDEGFQSKFLAWTVRRDGTDDGKTLVHVGSRMYSLPSSLSEVKGLLDKMEEFYVDLPDEFDCMIEAFLQEYVEEHGEELCHENVVSMGLHEALEEWTSHEFIAERDSRIAVKNRLRRLAHAQDLDTMSTLHEAAKRYVVRTEKGAQAKVLQAIRKRDKGAKVDPEKNPITAWVTTKLTLKQIEDMDGVEDVVLATKQEDLDEGMGYRMKAGDRKMIQAFVRGEDGKGIKAPNLSIDGDYLTGPSRGRQQPLATRKGTKIKVGDAHGNVSQTWVTAIAKMAKAEGATVSRLEETCTVEITREIVWDAINNKTVVENHLILDDEDMGEIDDATTSAMVSGFRTAGLGSFKVGEKATTKVVKCPGCDGKVLAATGYCVKCKKKTVKEDFAEMAEFKAKLTEAGFKYGEYHLDSRPEGVVLTLFESRTVKKAKKLFPGVEVTTHPGEFPRWPFAEMVLKENLDEKTLVCPNCDSTNVKRKDKKSKDYICLQCGQTGGRAQFTESEGGVDEAVEAYIRSLPWSEDATEDEKTLVAGNIRAFAAHTKEDLDEYDVTILNMKHYTLVLRAGDDETRQIRKALRNKEGFKVDPISRRETRVTMQMRSGDQPPDAKAKLDKVLKAAGVKAESIDEAKTYGLTLEKIRMGGEHQAFKVLKGKSLVGFLMQTGRNTADEEHPWKAFRVAQGGRVGEKIGFYYKKDGGKGAALQAIARTGLESVDETMLGSIKVMAKDAKGKVKVSGGFATVILPDGDAADDFMRTLRMEYPKAKPDRRGAVVKVKLAESVASLTRRSTPMRRAACTWSESSCSPRTRHYAASS
jgi:hypothetical protein